MERPGQHLVQQVQFVAGYGCHLAVNMALLYSRVIRSMILSCALAAAALASVAYRLESAKPLSRFSPSQRALLAKLNHADEANLAGLSKILVPDRWDSDELQYSPMPRQIDRLAAVGKALVVDLGTQTFGAYAYGELVRWGPVSSGDERHETPAGTYHLNWHALVRHSSENPEWIMRWYFNFSNERGLALHEYTLPGRPASHGCVRLLEQDAKWLYDWGDSWTLDPETNDLMQNGTLLFVVGRYNFATRQPWLNPKWWKKGVDVQLPADEDDPQDD